MVASEVHEVVGIAAGFGRQAGQDDPELVTERVLDEARRAFGWLDEVFLEQIVHDAIADLWGDSIQVTTFVPVLAMRRVREVVAIRAVAGLEPANRPA